MDKEIKKLTAAQREDLLRVLKARFEENMHRHPGFVWAEVQARLEAKAEKCWSLRQMEETGGAPDVVGTDPGVFVFYDCAPESPVGRRNLCYDQEALASRKEHKPRDSAVAMASAMGIAMLSEAQYRALQSFGAFDTKTSSWVVTPEEIRRRGGALFCDRRYDHVFTYHNGAESYYAVRGFRGLLSV